MTEQPGTDRWQVAIARADADLLDCLAVNMAVILAWHGAADVRTPFAARWRFRLRADGTRPGRPDLPPRDLETDLRELAGWEVRWRAATHLAGEWSAWAAVCDEGQPVLVVADAFDMPWVPYAGHEHMEHSFVVTGVDGASLAIADGYTNATEWGPAHPVTTTIDRAQIADLLAGAGRWSVPRASGPPADISADRLISANVDEILTAAQLGRYESFLRRCTALAQAADLGPVALDTWLLARSRRLHGRWLDAEAAACLPAAVREDFAVSVAAAWTRAVEISYIASRRARAGRAVPPSMIECLRQACSAEQDLARALRDGSGFAGLTAPGGADAC